MALDGINAIVGTSTSAYIFQYDGTLWEQKSKLVKPEYITGSLGYSVDISGDYAIVGAAGNDDNGSRSGSAYIYNFFIPGNIAMPWIPLLLLGE